MNRIIENVAKKYDVNVDDCREEIRAALKLAGIDLEPEQVILLSAAHVLTLLISDPNERPK